MSDNRRMPPSPSPARTSPPWLLALEELGGAALVLDRDLRIVAATPAAEGILAVPLPPGALAIKLLCGDASERPVAEALTAGRPVVAAVARALPTGAERLVGVRATPLVHDGDRHGWLILLRDDLTASEGIEEPVEFQGMWTRDAGMKRLFQLITRAAASDASVLVRGETGAGKELVANALHRLSPRQRGPFRAINCAALPPALLESELFGHVRGAFTGAVRDSAGHFRLAHEGTLFLDEVAELSLDLQAKLLRVVETRTIIPVGGRDEVAVDTRLVAATHRSLRHEVEAGRFRADLMYRLRVVPLFLPPLRSRRGDTALLAEKIVDALNARGGRQVRHIASSAVAALERHTWPGNVRELRNVLEYAYVMGDGDVLVEADLPLELLDPTAEESSAYPINRPDPSAGGPQSPERVRLLRALERASGNRDRAARTLGISRSTLWRRMRAFGID
ncbi:MAG TPA: sigma 54-interacting transcriptional regulator [Polyangia bacterium]